MDAVAGIPARPYPAPAPATAAPPSAAGSRPSLKQAPGSAAAKSTLAPRTPHALQTTSTGLVVTGPLDVSACNPAGGIPCQGPSRRRLKCRGRWHVTQESRVGNCVAGYFDRFVTGPT